MYLVGGIYVNSTAHRLSLDYMHTLFHWIIQRYIHSRRVTCTSLAAMYWRNYRICYARRMLWVY